jgi:hypothetical protein
MKQGTLFATIAGLVAGTVFLAPGLQARQCSGNGDVVGSFGFTGSRTGFYLLGATASASSATTGLMIPVPVTPPGTAGVMTPVAVTPPGTTFVGSNTAVGSLMAGLENSVVFTSIGRLFADGAGTLFGSPTTGVTTNIQVGTYTVSPSCSVSMTLTDPFVTTAGVTTLRSSSTPGISATLTGFVSQNGTELDMAGATGAVVTFRKTSQAGSCNNGSLSGNYTASGNGFYFPGVSNGLIVPGTGAGVVNQLPNPTATCMFNGTPGTGSCTGAFTFGATGTLGTAFSLLGRFVADGNGNLVTDLSGQTSPQGGNLTGTYTVNADCTGTGRLIDSNNIARDILFVLVNQGSQGSSGSGTGVGQALQFVFNDTGVLGGGSAQLQ